MYRIYLRLIVGLAVFLAACNPAGEATTKKPAAAKPTPPTVDRTTPDRALKSYWGVLDWTHARRNSAELLTPELRTEVKAIIALHNSAVTGRMVRNPDAELQNEPASYDRDILDVKVETESRAVILTRVRNTTPVPDGIKPTTRDLAKRDQGDQYRYVLEKEPDGWRVAEVWEFEDFFAKGWRESYRSKKREPIVPTSTYGGI